MPPVTGVARQLTALPALLVALAACERASIASPPGPVASFEFEAPPLTTTYRLGDSLDLARIITHAEDGFGQPIRVGSLRPQWAVTQGLGGVPVAEGRGLKVPVPEPGPDGRAWVYLWVVYDMPPDGIAEAAFAITVAPE